MALKLGYRKMFVLATEAVYIKGELQMVGAANAKLRETKKRVS